MNCRPPTRARALSNLSAAQACPRLLRPWPAVGLCLHHEAGRKKKSHCIIINFNFDCRRCRAPQISCPAHNAAPLAKQQQQQQQQQQQNGGKNLSCIRDVPQDNNNNCCNNSNNNNCEKATKLKLHVLLISWFSQKAPAKQQQQQQQQQKQKQQKKQS
ncbi:hypothetical protein AWZ03_004479 [Drosophila navojoa]|uniref:Uncharacterized protein n=1 Tax=Drosophila navojoa TaxID=7232 RepID=A0A484BK28_DRONA|nr:hypothetical protein AWZ03_004479 [Drosophila navojoa]